MTIRVVVADDHPVFRVGLEQVLREADGLELVGTAPDGNAAVELIERERPDVAVVDVSMPGRDGFGVLEEARTRGFSTRFVILTLSDDEGYLNRALSLGATGYVLKDDAIDLVVDAVRAAANGESWVSGAVAERASSKSGHDDAVEKALALLTPAERKVLALLADSLTSAEVAKRLSLSVRTVQNHRAHMCERLNLRGSHKLLEFAIAHRDRLR